MYIKNYLNDEGEVSPEMLEKLNKETEVALKETLDKVKLELELILAFQNPSTSYLVEVLTQYETQAACAKLTCELLKKELSRRYEESQKEDTKS